MFPSHVPQAGPPHHGPESDVDDDAPLVQRVLIAERDEALFRVQFQRLTYARGTISALWSQVRRERFGSATLPPPPRADRVDFVSNDSHANREPIGRVIVRWRRLANSEHLIDLELVNVPLDEGLGHGSTPH